MDKQYKEWLQDQTFETLTTDNYNVKLLLLAEQAKNKELENQRTVDCEECERNNSKNSSCFECLCIKLNSEQAKNKKLVEALEEIRWYKAIGKDVHKIQQIAAHAVTGIDVLENGLRGLEVNNAK